MNMRFKRLVAMGGILLSFLSHQTNLHSVWSPSQTISNPAIDQTPFYQGLIVVNPQGNALAVWTDSFSNVYPFPPALLVTAISGAFFQRNVGWQPPQNISSLEESQFGGPLFAFNGDPDVAMNSTNYAVVVWESILINEASPNVVAAAVRDPVTGIWGPSVVISNNTNDTNILAENVNVSLNEAGTALASWRNLNENGDFMYCSASFLPQGGTWTLPVNFAPFTTNGFDGKATPFINPSGNAVVTWQGRDANDNYNIQVVTYNAVTNTWSPVTTLDTDTAGITLSEDPRCKMDPNGNAVVVWQKDGVVSTSFFNGVAWGPIVTLGNCIPQSDEDGPDIVVDNFGIFTVTWTDVNNNIVASCRLLDGTWIPQIISTPGTSNFFNPFQSNKPLAVNPAGDLMQVWFSGDTTQIIQSAFKPFGQPWQAPEVVDASNDYASGDLSVGLANCGFAVADWETSGKLLVKAAIHENLSFPGNGTPTVTHCCAKFATHDSCVDIIQVAPNPCAASFNIYCNGVFAANLPNNGANPLTFTIPSCKKSTCTFTVTSVSAFGVESVPVPVTVLPCPCKELR